MVTLTAIIMLEWAKKELGAPVKSLNHKPHVNSVTEHIRGSGTQDKKYKHARKSRAMKDKRQAVEHAVTQEKPPKGTRSTSTIGAIYHV